MTINEINKILSKLAEQPSRENVLNLSFALLDWMGVASNDGDKPQLLSPQTQKLKDYLVPAPQTVQPQLYRLSSEGQNIRIRFAVLKKLKKDYISQLVDNDPGLGSYQSFARGLTTQGSGAAFIPTQPYFIHFVTTPDYNKLVLIFNQGDQKRVVSFRNRLTNTQYNRIILAWQGIASKSKPEIADLFWKSLDIKEVNKEFYKQIKERFDALLGIVKTQHTSATENQVKQYTVRLIGRYIFCWFLKEKGIIPLSLIGKETIEKTDNYYQNVLLKLFFETLNTKVQDRNPLTLNKLFEKIPYLNGGLFDESEEDKLFTGLKLDAWLLPFVEILESYDFTVDESSSQYQQVAVDPEMLGRIFENLLASQNEETEKLANQRKASGAFYTPREIVDYMVNESIKAYLQTQWEESIVEERSKHLNNPEPVGDIFGNKKSQQLAIEVKRYQLKEEEKQKIEKSLSALFAPQPNTDGLKKEEKVLLLGFLEKIKILDPACGSGAFPMGILHKLVELHELLGTVKSAYELKKDILSQNIYGVDIMPMAIEIARLRAWLSLVLEEEYKPSDSKHNFGVKPLPNLDFKFVCANSLIDLGLDSFINESKGTFHEGFTEKLVNDLKELEALRTKFFQPSLGLNDKEKLKKKYFEELDKVIIDIEAAHDPVLKKIAQKLKQWDPFNDSYSSPFFSPTWMFGVDRGFDLVIANPPYIKERDNAHTFKQVNESEFGKMWHTGKMDYWFYFLHKAIDVSNKNGIVTFITSRYWLNSQGAKKLIRRVKEKLSFINFVDIGKLKVFDNVAGHHMIAVYSKNKYDSFIYKKVENDISEILNEKSSSNLKIRKIQNDIVFNSNDEIIIETNDFEYKKDYVLDDFYDTSIGVQESPDKISAKNLKEKPHPTIKVGDGVFVLTENELNALGLSNKELSVVVPYLDPSHVAKYSISAKDKKYLIYADKEVRDMIAFNPDFKNLKKHLDYYKDYITSSNAPYGLHRSRNKDYFQKEKLVFKNMFVSPEFTIDGSGYYLGFSFSSVLSKDENYSLEYLLAILNSRFADFWFYQNGKIRGAGVDIGVEKLRLFPINQCFEQQKFKVIVEYLLFINNVNNPPINDYSKNASIVPVFEDVVNMMVYEVYFNQHMKELEIDVLKFFDTQKHFLPIDTSENANKKVNAKIIGDCYRWLQEQENPIRNRILLSNIKSPDILKRINASTH